MIELLLYAKKKPGNELQCGVSLAYDKALLYAKKKPGNECEN